MSETKNQANLKGAASRLLNFRPVVAHRLPNALGRTVKCAISTDELARELRLVFRMRNLADDLD